MDLPFGQVSIRARAREWDELMRTFQEPVEGAQPGKTWVPMTEVYALEAKKE